jgi:uncharacterized protein (DUF362 family)
MLSRNSKIGLIWDTALEYPLSPQSHPPEIYPELSILGYNQTDHTNRVYSLLRELFIRLGFDQENVGKEDWNPFGEFIQPGNVVVIKPNLVFHEKPGLLGSNSVVTHSSLLRPIIDYCLLALRGRGKCIICDAPLQSADMGAIIRSNNLQSLLDFYKERGLPVEFYDLRFERVVMDDHGFFSKRVTQSGDPRGYVEIDLGTESALEPITPESKSRFGVSDYSSEITCANHQKGRHVYFISRTALEADVFINVPKLKTHQKAGLSVCLKNLIGINGRKDYLPHFRWGSPNHGGDEYWDKHVILHQLHSWARERLQGKNKLVFYLMRGCWTVVKQAMGIEARQAVRSDRGFQRKRFFIAGGAWYGNDVIWRTILDINKILFYCDKTGKMRDTPQRRYFAVIDGVVAGEGNGPIDPIPRKAGILLAGFDPVVLDWASAQLMGFDPFRIPLTRNAFLLWEHSEFRSYNLFEILEMEIEAQIAGEWQKIRIKDLPSLNFLAPPGWAGVIERYMVKNLPTLY